MPEYCLSVCSCGVCQWLSTETQALSVLRNDKNPTNLSLVFFLADKKLKKNELNFFVSQPYGQFETPGEVQLTPFISTGQFSYF